MRPHYHLVNTSVWWRFAPKDAMFRTAYSLPSCVYAELCYCIPVFAQKLRDLGHTCTFLAGLCSRVLAQKLYYDSTDFCA